MDVDVEEAFVLALFPDERFDVESRPFKIAGLETGEPFVQLGRNKYRGVVSACFGTDMFFEEVESEARGNEICPKSDELRFFGTGVRELELKEALLEPKESTESTKKAPVERGQRVTTAEEALDELAALAEELRSDESFETLSQV